MKATVTFLADLCKEKLNLDHWRWSHVQQRNILSIQCFRSNFIIEKTPCRWEEVVSFCRSVQLSWSRVMQLYIYNFSNPNPNSKVEPNPIIIFFLFFQSLMSLLFRMCNVSHPNQIENFHIWNPTKFHHIEIDSTFEIISIIAQLRI